MQSELRGGSFRSDAWAQLPESTGPVVEVKASQNMKTFSFFPDYIRCIQASVLSLLLTLLYMSSPSRSRSLKCVQEVNCKLPFCFCTNNGGPEEAKIPGGLRSSEIPQQVLFSFDDAVNVQNFGLYNRLFAPHLKNPNGCPVAMTLFVSDEWTNYSMVHQLYQRGMEIAIHSVTHRTPSTFWRDISIEDMRFEIRQQKLNICTKGKVRGGDIRGYRGPFLETSGDTMFRVMRENRLEYDSTHKGKFTTTITPQQWPFTLDFGYDLDCQNYKCPQRRYPGFWEVPVIALVDLDDRYICTYADSCFTQPETKEETLEFLWKNFEMNYNGVRAPLYLNMHSSFFAGDSRRFRIDAAEEFIARLLEMEEVYLVTYHQSIEWMKFPTRLRDIKRFKPWQCD